MMSKIFIRGAFLIIGLFFTYVLTGKLHIIFRIISTILFLVSYFFLIKNKTMFDILKIALKSLYNNKLRTILSSLGVIIGVATIVLVIGIGIGAQRTIEEQYANLAVTSLMVNPVSSDTQRTQLSDEDIPIIKGGSQYIENVVAILQSKMLVSDAENSLSLGVLGVGNDFLEISRLKIEEGRYFSDEEISDKPKVAVIGEGAALDFFGNAKDIVGKTVNIGKKKIEIIGVFQKSGTAIGPITYDDTIFIPYKTATQIIGDSSTPRLIALAKDINSISLAISELSQLLRENHRLKASDTDDFRIVDQGSKVVAAQESSATMTLLLTSVAIIVLVVSGIGIMNVMFAGVAERTKEIGILKSIGIRRSDILNIFLFESVILSIGGGLIGIALGELLIPLIQYLDLIRVETSIFGKVLAFSFAVFVGVFFGYYPAYKASQLDPVDALRS